MKVYVAEQAGFCFGVKRALNIINQLYDDGQKIQIYGQLIHNKTVLDDLESKDITRIDSLDQLDPTRNLIVRTHGIPKNEEENLKGKNVSYTDATCPLVKNLHHIIRDIDSRDLPLVIVGDRKHPEITAAASYCDDTVIIDSLSEAEKLPKGKKRAVAAQTTLDTNHFKTIVSALVDNTGTLEVHNTICEATRVRQQAIRELAPKVDGVIVIGGKNSSNTRKLFQIASRQNPNTFHIEKSTDLENPHVIDKIRNFDSIGVTAGASTPPGEIENVERILNKMCNEGE